MPDIASDYSLRDLARDVQMFHVELKEDQLERLATYARLLGEWNERMNLTAIAVPSDVYVKHFVDSLALCMLPEFAKADNGLLDVGSGAGFPGLVLKIARPGLRVTLCDALEKRVRFLQAVIAELGLVDIMVCHGRAEELAKLRSGHRDAYPFVTARAVAALPVLAEWCLPFVAPGGHFVAMKGPGGHAEALQAESAARALSGRVKGVRGYSLPRDAGERTLVVIAKSAPTPRQFPRRPGAASRTPL